MLIRVRHQTNRRPFHAVSPTRTCAYVCAHTRVTREDAAASRVGACVSRVAAAAPRVRGWRMSSDRGGCPAGLPGCRRAVVVAIARSGVAKGSRRIRWATRGRVAGILDIRAGGVIVCLTVPRLPLHQVAGARRQTIRG